MNLRHKALVGMLLTAILTAAWMPASPLSAQVQNHPVGCHEHNGAPASDHRCCLTGHDVAAVETSHVQRTMVRPAFSASKFLHLLFLRRRSGLRSALS